MLLDLPAARRWRETAAEHQGTAIAVAVVLLIYAPAFDRNMLWFDDWGGQKFVAGGQTLWHSIQSWFPVMGYRPFGGVFLGTVNWLFLHHGVALFPINIATFLAGNVLLGLVAARVFGNGVLVPWLLLSGMPIAAGAQLYSPINMLCYNVVVLAWAAAAWSVIRHGHAQRWILAASAACFITLLTYDLVFPVVLVGCVILFLTDPHAPLARRVLRWLPILAAILLASAYQKLIVPALGGMNLSRLDIAAILNPGRWLATGAQVFAAELRSYAVGLQTLHATPLTAYLLAALAAIAACFAIARRSNGAAPAPSSVRWLVILAALLVSTLTYILSDYQPTPFGYDSRVLAPSWSLLALAVAGGLSMLRPGWRMPILSALLIPLVIGACVQRREFVQAATQRLAVLRDVRQISSEVPKGARLMLHVRRALPGSRFGVTVIAPPWEAAGIIADASDGRSRGVAVAASRIRVNMVRVSGDSLVVDGWWSVDFVRYPLYFFDPARRILCHVGDAATMQGILRAIVANPLPEDLQNTPGEPLNSPPPLGRCNP